MELLRYRPPATMVFFLLFKTLTQKKVPHIANENTILGNSYPIEKGNIILPSIWSAHMDDFENGDQFDPERIISPEKFITFGVGPHKCLGLNYAINHLMLFTSILIKNYKWKRVMTKDCDNIIFLPTIFPKHCEIFLEKK